MFSWSAFKPYQDLPWSSWTSSFIFRCVVVLIVLVLCWVFVLVNLVLFPLVPFIVLLFFNDRNVNRMIFKRFDLDVDCIRSANVFLPFWIFRKKIHETMFERACWWFLKLSVTRSFSFLFIRDPNSIPFWFFWVTQENSFLSTFFELSLFPNSWKWFTFGARPVHGSYGVRPSRHLFGHLFQI